MIPLPKPRGFWDYAPSVLAMTGVLVLLFWLEASDGMSWTDAALAFAAATLFVLGVIIARRAEKAWMARPTWYAYLLVCLGAFLLVFGAIYADAYLLHRTDITSKRLRDDAVFAMVLTAGTLWSARRRRSAGRQLW